MLDLIPPTQLAYTTAPAKPSLHALLADKARTLADLVAECGREIDDRRTLSQYLLLSMEAEARALRSELLSCDDVPGPRRTELECRLTTLLRDQRLESVAAFRETAVLGQEKRRWAKSYQDLQQRLRLLAPQATL